MRVNGAVLLFGLAGLFAKWVHLPALGITFFRVLFSSVTLGAYLMLKRQSFKTPDRKTLFICLLAGAVLALHWWTFLESIQRSTVAIGTLTFSTFPLFVTLAEPLIFKTKLKARHILIVVFLLAGVVVTIPELSLKNNMVQGVLIGMVSALSYAVLTLLNKGLTQKMSSSLTAFYEQASACLVLLPAALGLNLAPSAADLCLLVFLGAVTTAFAHTLFITSLKDLPARLAGVCSSMEPVYGILFAWLLLKEAPTLREGIGAVIIVGTVIIAQVME